jgi:hypothetical protein
VLTLPAINTSANPTTSGPGQDPSTANNEGVTYTIWVPTTISTSSLKIGTNGTDKFVGSLISVDTDTSGAVVGFTAGASNDFINLNGTTTGGVAGTWIRDRCYCSKQATWSPALLTVQVLLLRHCSTT